MSDVKDAKKENLYQSVLQLLEQGSDIHDIKVSDIARAAGMGKGTVYEYFTSREELIARAVLYAIHLKVLEVNELLQSTRGFDAMLRCLCSYIIEQSRTQKFLLDSIFNESGLHEIRSLLENSSELMRDGELIRQYVSMLISEAEREGVLRIQANRHYAEQAVRTALFGLVREASCPLLFLKNNCPDDMLIDNTIKFLRGALKEA